MHIAIFGGSFDPVHLAHVQIVKKAKKTLDIDKLIIVPTYLNPFKKEFYFKPEIRFQFLKKIFKNQEDIEISDYEINQTKTIYSIDTVKYLKNRYNPSKIYFIIGADNIINLDKWNNIEQLKSLVTFVVATRNGYKLPSDFVCLDVDIDISSTKLRENLSLKYIPNEIKDDIIQVQKEIKGKNI